MEVLFAMGDYCHGRLLSWEVILCCVLRGCFSAECSFVLLLIGTGITFDWTGLSMKVWLHDWTGLSFIWSAGHSGRPHGLINGWG